MAVPDLQLLCATVRAKIRDEIPTRYRQSSPAALELPVAKEKFQLNFADYDPNRIQLLVIGRENRQTFRALRDLLVDPREDRVYVSFPFGDVFLDPPIL